MGASLVYVVAAAAFVACVAVLIFFLHDRATKERIRALIDLTNEVLGSQSKDEPVMQGGDEIDALARSLSTVASEVRGVVDKLRIEGARRETILSSMAEGVLVVDKDLRVIFSNEAMRRALAVRRPVSDRVPLLELVRDAEILAILGEVIRSGNSSKRSMRLGAASGRSYEIYATPTEAGSGGGAIAIFHDITDLERLEQVRKDFVANVSHEMRTPLASIIAYSETLLEGALDAPEVNRKFVEVIRSNAVRLNNISTDLLTLSDLESGASPGQAEPVPVHEVLESALRTMQPEARSSGIQIVQLGVEEFFVIGHRLRLEQALLNLLANAVKFNRPGGEVHVEVSKGENGSVNIAVSDSGIGIPSEDLPRIFERFYRVDKARSREVGGTGLGLSIVKHVVEAMNGNVRVESQLGKGSRFTITLPAAPVG